MTAPEMIHQQLRKHLQRLRYFVDLDSAIVDILAEGASPHQFTSGETIFLEGDVCEGLFLIESGRVKIYKLSPQGDEQILRILGEGNTFNDIAAFDGGGNPANAEALSPLRLWVIPATSLSQLMQTHNVLALRVVQVMAGRVRSLVGQIEDLTLYSVVVRLARFLIRQSDDPALSGPGVTRSVIAGQINTTPQTISNALNSLQKAGAIEFDRHQITIVRPDLLRSIAEL